MEKVRKDKDLNKATIIRLKDINYAKKEDKSRFKN